MIGPEGNLTVPFPFASDWLKGGCVIKPKASGEFY